MHISLDAALQRQPLLSTVGDKLLPSFPGAAAAYSLRALNGDANDVVRVRRSGDADGTTNERDFTAEGVALELEDWVNGKLETTLPCDVATAAAAYSLRKVRNDYPGDAVQIRRASDDVEVNVAFDSNDEVSDSSAITNIPVGNFPTSVAQNRTGGARYSTFTTDGIYSFSAIANTVALGGYVIDEGSAGDIVTVSFDLTLNSGSITNVVLRPELETGSDVSNSSGSISSSGSYSFDLTATDAYSVVGFISVNGDFTVSNVSIQVRQDAGDTTATTLGAFLTEGGNQDATVVTWYDQSGNGNDATQLTTGSQPLIAENGSLLEVLEFDGSNYFELDSSISQTAAFSYFFVLSGLPETGKTLIGFSAAATPRVRLESSNLEIKTTNTELNFSTTSWDGTSSILSFNRNDSNLVSANRNGVSFGTPSTATGNLTHDRLFKLDDANAGEFIGRCSEVIIYTSDQSDNRFKIESNINNYYGIYTPAYDGFVETWYDQSGNDNHAVQAYTPDQPKIVSAGSYLGELDFDGSNDVLVASAFLSTDPLSMFIVASQPDGVNDANEGIMSFAGLNSPNSNFMRFNTFESLRQNDFNTAAAAGAGFDFGTDDDSGLFTYILGADFAKAYKDGGSESIGYSGVETTLNVSRDLCIGQGFFTSRFTGQINEIILYPSDQSANRPAIESNIADEYGITLS